LLKINLDFSLRKTGASLNFKIKLGSLQISPGEKEMVVKFCRESFELDHFLVIKIFMPILKEQS
jgi:hypothetical protein